VNILARTAPAVTTEALTTAWRLAHWIAVEHLIAASYTHCGCTAPALCTEGQRLDELAEDAERRLALVERRWA
jgi:hypothetical protein